MGKSLIILWKSRVTVALLSLRNMKNSQMLYRVLRKFGFFPVPKHSVCSEYTIQKFQHNRSSSIASKSEGKIVYSWENIHTVFNLTLT